MSKLLKEIRDDVEFVKGHRLQPQWYKVLKVFLVLGFVAGYWLLFGVVKTLIFVAVFASLAVIVHLVYRLKTRKWTQSWLDFVVTEKDGEMTPTRIGKYYYTAVALDAVLSLVISQVLG